MGLIDYHRLPKRSWYWYRNEYRHIPPPEWPKEGTPVGLKLEAGQTTLAHVDGTDDTLLVATVVDAAGKPISNSAPVTLAIESGPASSPPARRSPSRPIPTSRSAMARRPSSFARITRYYGHPRHLGRFERRDPHDHVERRPGLCAGRDSPCSRANIIR